MPSNAGLNSSQSIYPNETGKITELPVRKLPATKGIRPTQDRFPYSFPASPAGDFLIGSKYLYADQALSVTPDLCLCQIVTEIGIKQETVAVHP